MEPKEGHFLEALWAKGMVTGTLPPLVPALPPDGLDWDTNFVVHTTLFRTTPESERRHSGWEAVEKGWTDNDRVPPASKGEKVAPPKALIEAMSKLRPSLSLPPPQLEADFRMRVVLNSNVATVAAGDGFKKWTTFTEGAWSGIFASGTVVDGGQETVELEEGTSSATQIESTYKLRTIDEPPASIECKARGFRTGPVEIMQELQRSESAQAIDPRQYRHRTLITMRTNDKRYAEKLNFEMWVGTCLWHGSEVIYDAYRIR